MVLIRFNSGPRPLAMPNPDPMFRSRHPPTIPEEAPDGRSPWENESFGPGSVLQCPQVRGPGPYGVCTDLWIAGYRVGVHREVCADEAKEAATRSLLPFFISSVLPSFPPACFIYHYSPSFLIPFLTPSLPSFLPSSIHSFIHCVLIPAPSFLPSVFHSFSLSFLHDSCLCLLWLG